MGGIPFGTLWFDIETGGNLGADADHAWLQAGVQEAVNRLGGSRVGIYASDEPESHMLRYDRLLICFSPCFCVILIICFLCFSFSFSLCSVCRLSMVVL